MPRTDFSQLFDKLEAMSLGFGPLFKDFSTINVTYPPHNIIKNTDNVYILELAVAGFKKNEISITERKGDLTIKGSKNNGFPEDKEDSYQFQGIGRRNFEKKFKLAQFMEIVDAKLEDGILTITIMRNIPEEESENVIVIK